jgi:hypothetical protein
LKPFVEVELLSFLKGVRVVGVLWEWYYLGYTL